MRDILGLIPPFVGVDGHLSVMLSDSGQPPPGLVTNSSGFVQAARS